MSIDASRWAWSAAVESSAQRLVLLALADRADENHECYPSLERVELDTCLNIKTVQTTVTRLIEIGLVADTGKRKGPTQRVRVLRLVGVVGREERAKKVRYDTTEQVENDPKNNPFKDPKNGAVKRPQKRNDTKNGMIPFLDLNDPKNGVLNDPKNGVLNDPKNGVQNLSLNLPLKLSKNLLSEKDFLNGFIWAGLELHMMAKLKKMSGKISETTVLKMAYQQDGDVLGVLRRLERELSV